MKLKPPIEGRLADTHLIWLTTVSPDGAPQPSLVWFWWDGESFLIYSQPGRPKLANISNNASVALNLDAMARGTEEVTVIQASAVIDPSAPPVADHAEYLARYRGLIEDDLGMTVEEFSADYSVPIRVTPTSTRAW
jgi:PPOX class probable F420-dependent enzyme